MSRETFQEVADFREAFERRMKKCNTSPKMDRKTAERNRRIQMKTLYSRLDSLIPDQNSKEVKLLAEKLDVATNYIKVLQEKLETMKERKEHLMDIDGRNKITKKETKRNLQSPHIEIQDLGPALVVVLICGLDNQSMFYKSIRILEEEGAEVVNAGFCLTGDKAFHTIHSKIPVSKPSFEVTRVSRRLHELVHEMFADI